MSINRAATLTVIRPYHGIVFAVYIHMGTASGHAVTKRKIMVSFVKIPAPTADNLLSAYKYIGKLWKDIQQTENSDYQRGRKNAYMDCLCNWKEIERMLF